MVWAITGRVAAWPIAFGLIMFAANVLDPNGLGNSYHPWSSLCGLVALFAMLMGLGIFIHGMGTAQEQRRA